MHADLGPLAPISWALYLQAALSDLKEVFTVDRLASSAFLALPGSHFLQFNICKLIAG